MYSAQKNMTQRSVTTIRTNEDIQARLGSESNAVVKGYRKRRAKSGLTNYYVTVMF